MPNVGTTIVPSSAVNTPVVDNVSTSGTADTETTFSFPASTKRFLIRNRGGSLVKLSYAVGTSGTDYFSIYPSTDYWEEGIGASALSIYIQSPSPSQVLEILSWS